MIMATTMEETASLHNSRPCYQTTGLLSKNYRVGNMAAISNYWRTHLSFVRIRYLYSLGISEIESRLHWCEETCWDDVLVDELIKSQHTRLRSCSIHTHRHTAQLTTDCDLNSLHWKKLHSSEYYCNRKQSARSITVSGQWLRMVDWDGLNSWNIKTMIIGSGTLQWWIQTKQDGEIMLIKT